MERMYIVCYDIRDDKRWRKVYKTMKGYGEWVQLSVFQCRLDKIGLLKMTDDINSIIHHKDDHVLIIDIGQADKVKLKIQSLGRTYKSIDREPIIV